MASGPRSEAINLVNAFICSNQNIGSHFVFTWKRQQYAIIDLLQCYVNSPALCHNIIQRDRDHLDILQNTLMYYIDDKHDKSASSESLLRDAIRESKTSWSPQNLTHDYFVVFLLISISMNTKFGLRFAFFASLYWHQVAKGGGLKHLPISCY